VTATALPFAPLWLATILLTLVVAIRAAIPRRRARPIRLKVLGRALMPARMLRSASGRLDIAAFLFATMIATSVLGWAPKVGLQEGLARTVEYYARHHAHYWDSGA